MATSASLKEHKKNTEKRGTSVKFVVSDSAKNLFSGNIVPCILA